MKVALIQLSTIENNKEATLKKAKKKIEQCSNADLIILPEIWNIGFMSFSMYTKSAETLDGPTTNLMRKLAQKKRVFLHTGSFIEKKNKKYYNTSLLLSPNGKIIAKYRKIHLFGYKSQEANILSSGNKVIVADTSFGKIGMATCFDLRFPELFRAMVKKKADFFLICSAWPNLRLETWLLLNKTRALENQVYLISANSSGINRKTKFAGNSMVVDPSGNIVAKALRKETIVKAKIKPCKIKSTRKKFPWLSSQKKFLS